MRSNHTIQTALKQAGLSTEIAHQRVLSGGATQQVIKLTLSDGSSRVAKLASGTEAERIRAEADGLRALREHGHLLVPEHNLTEDDTLACLLMDHLSPANSTTNHDWTRFADELADHHQAPTGERFGWRRDNFIGATPQPNGWCDDWVEFNAEHRLGHQLRLAKEQNADSTITDPIERVIEHLADFIPRRPHPALLHGDLWSGNVLPTTHQGETRIAVIDPAVSIGDAWADIAMLKLFGSPPSIFFDTYEQRCQDRERVPQRILVYQLYHMLNHLNLFGGGYEGSVSSIAQRLLSM
jgi:fructosamine-3-kinase